MKVGIKLYWIIFFFAKLFHLKVIIVFLDVYHEMFGHWSISRNQYGANITCPLAQHNPDRGFIFKFLCLAMWTHNVHWSNINDLMWTVIECSSIRIKCNISALLILISLIPYNFISRFTLLICVSYISCIASSIRLKFVYV